MRWFQFGAFSPIFRAHGTHTPREPWRFGGTSGWAYPILKKYTELRYSLLPYIYSEVCERCGWVHSLHVCLGLVVVALSLPSSTNNSMQKP